MLFFSFLSTFLDLSVIGISKSSCCWFNSVPTVSVRLIKNKPIALRFPLTHVEQNYIKREHFWKPLFSVTVQKSLPYNHLSKPYPPVNSAIYTSKPNSC